MKHFAWDYEENYYHVYGISDFSGIPFFTVVIDLPQTKIGDEAIKIIVNMLDFLYEYHRLENETQAE